MCADGYLARGFVERNGLERLVVVIVYGLQEGIGVTKDRKGVACDVGLDDKKPSQQTTPRVLRDPTLTVTRRESQQPVARAWSWDSGFPGRTTFILPACWSRERWQHLETRRRRRGSAGRFARVESRGAFDGVIDGYVEFES